MEKREPSYTFGGNANYYSYYGEQCGDSFKKLEIETINKWDLIKLTSI